MVLVGGDGGGGGGGGGGGNRDRIVVIIMVRPACLLCFLMYHLPPPPPSTRPAIALVLQALMRSMSSMSESFKKKRSQSFGARGGEAGSKVLTK